MNDAVMSSAFAMRRAENKRSLAEEYAADSYACSQETTQTSMYWAKHFQECANRAFEEAVEWEEKAERLLEWEMRKTK